MRSIDIRATLLTAMTSLAAGCTTGLGPHAIGADRPDYNQQIVRSANAEMLLNLVRLRYDDTPLFLELGTVVSQYGVTASLNASGGVSGSSGTGSGGGSLGYSEAPTLTFTPLGGAEFAERMLSPLSLDAVMLFIQAGWSPERVLLVGIQRINDLYNAPTATGPIPEFKPDYEGFFDFVERFQRLFRAHLAGFNWERTQGEKNPPGRDPQFWLETPADPKNPLAADVEAVRSLLGLEPGRTHFDLTGFPYGRTANEVGMRGRSLLGILYFLSSAVEPPAEDVAAGRVTLTRGERGQLFDWSELSGRVLRIRSQAERPNGAYVAIPYRGSWFYIADDDRSSKTTFSLLSFLFTLQSAAGTGKSPLLTLPVGP